MVSPSTSSSIKSTISTQLQRESEGYYRSKEIDSELFNELGIKYKVHIHGNDWKCCPKYETHKNEGMNTCVVKYALKTHNYGKSCSSETRVKISAAIYLVGYYFLGGSIQAV